MKMFPSPDLRSKAGVRLALALATGLAVACSACAATHRGLRDDPRAAAHVEAEVPVEPAPQGAPPPDAAFAVPSAPPAPPPASPPEPARPVPPIDVRNASKRYDFRILPRGPCAEPSSFVCAVPADLVLYAKGGDHEVQRIAFDEVDLVPDESGQALVNSAVLYDAQGTIQVGDFNFDGREDFAVQDSQNGSYGGPTFRVFLYDAPSARFAEADELSQLTRENLGFFQVDSKRRRLVVSGKSGCCFHITQEYSFVRGALVLEASLEENAMDENVVTTTRGVRDGDKWRTVTTKRPKTADEQ